MPNKYASLTWRWMTDVWNKGSEDAIEKYLHSTAVVHGLDNISGPGPAGFKVFYRGFREEFPKVDVIVEDVLSEEGYESARCIVTATHKNNKQVTFTGMTFIRVEQDKIVEAWNNFDFHTMYNQLGFVLNHPAEAAP